MRNLLRIHPRASHRIRFHDDSTRRHYGIPIVGCDVVAHVTSAGVLSDTRRGKQCELLAKKGGNANFRPFQSLTGKDFLFAERSTSW